MIKDRNIYLLALNELKNFGSQTIINLYKEYLYISTLHKFDQELFLNFLLKKYQYNQDIVSELKYKIHFIESEISKYEVTVVSYFDRLYPYQLKLLKKPPLFLFCRGNTALLKDDKTIAVVGTRENSSIGRQVATKTAEYFSERGYVIVSGLAKGIDTYGHIGALNKSGKTIAILTDIMKIYPAENKYLSQEILDNNGLLFSEIAPWKNIFRSAFVDRDRLQSGMSLGTFVIETDIKGGTMHTVKFTLEQDRLLFVPDYTLLGYEKGFSKINGTKYLLDENKATAYSKYTYQNILNELEYKREEIQHLNKRRMQNDRSLF